MSEPTMKLLSSTDLASLEVRSGRRLRPVPDPVPVDEPEKWIGVMQQHGHVRVDVTPIERFNAYWSSWGAQSYGMVHGDPIHVLGYNAELSADDEYPSCLVWDPLFESWWLVGRKAIAWVDRRGAPGGWGKIEKETIDEVRIERANKRRRKQFVESMTYCADCLVTKPVNEEGICRDCE